VLLAEDNDAILEALERMGEIRPDLPALFSTAHRSFVLDVLDPLPEGVGIIEKPYRLAELLRRVRAALEGG
jgi:DNA-binding response OmpR family regulator